LPPLYFDKSGRAFPDVSLDTVNYEIFCANCGCGINPVCVSGTSASAPAFAALVTIVNAERQHKGKSTLGLLNPALYHKKVRDAYNDVTFGNNRCLVIGYECCPYGFEASKGWDPVTGFGSVDFEKFKKALVDL